MQGPLGLDCMVQCPSVPAHSVSGSDLSECLTECQVRDRADQSGPTSDRSGPSGDRGGPSSSDRSGPLIAVGVYEENTVV